MVFVARRVVFTGKTRHTLVPAAASCYHTETADYVIVFVVLGFFFLFLLPAAADGRSVCTRSGPCRIKRAKVPPRPPVKTRAVPRLSCLTDGRRPEKRGENRLSRTTPPGKSAGVCPLISPVPSPATPLHFTHEMPQRHRHRPSDERPCDG